MKRTEQRRDALFAEARRAKAAIEQIFIDVAHWNDHVRSPSEEPIDPDPDGALACLLAYLDGILNGDVYVAPAETS